MAESTLFGPMLARGPVAEAVSDAAWLRAMLDAEAAISLAGAKVGLVPADAAAHIAAVCRSASLDVAALGAEATGSANPVVPLVEMLERAVGPETGRFVHRGATSQDVMDTAMVLVARRAIDLLTADLGVCAEAAASLARAHRDTVLAGRTLLQQALPTTFGLKAAGWVVALDGAASRLAGVRDHLPAQFGGGVGTLSAAGPHALALLDSYAEELGLAVPLVPWHALRLPVGDLAGAFGTAGGVLGKIALDVVLLSQTEVGEVAEGVPGRGASSTMPHKRNPVAAVCARAAARRVPGLVATLLSTMEHEHERAAGAWQAEWLPLSDLIATVGSAAAWLADSLGSLEVDAARMRANLQASGAALGAEAVAGALMDAIGREMAHHLVAEAVAVARRDGRELRTVLLEREEVAARLSADELDALLDVTRYVGQAPELVNRVLAARQERQ